MKIFENKQYLILSAIVVLGLVFAGAAYWPLSKKIKASREEKRQFQLAKLELQQMEFKLPELEKELVELESKIGEYDLKIPKDRNFAGFWQQITDVMDEYDLTERLVRPGNEIKGKTIACIPLDIECSGKLEQIYKFLKSLEGLDREVRVEQFSMRNDSELAGMIKVKALAKIYYRI